MKKLTKRCPKGVEINRKGAYNPAALKSLRFWWVVELLASFLCPCPVFLAGVTLLRV